MSVCEMAAILSRPQYTLSSRICDLFEEGVPDLQMSWSDYSNFGNQCPLLYFASVTFRYNI